MIRAEKQISCRTDDVTLDLHPNRPIYRGIAFPERIVSLEADPTFDELVAAGATVTKSKEAHTILDDMFLISGEIPRLTSYETGLRFAVQYDADEDDWFSDEVIADERFLACNLKGLFFSSFFPLGQPFYAMRAISRHAQLIVLKTLLIQERDSWSLRAAATPVSSIPPGMPFTSRAIKSPFMPLWGAFILPRAMNHRCRVQWPI